MTPEDELFAASLDALDDVFYLFDAECRLVRWNRRLNELFEATDEELAEQEPTAFFVAEDRPRVGRAVEEVVETGETTVEARAETTGGLVRFQLTGRRLESADGTFLGFTGVGRDVTDRRERERRLRSQNERLDAFADVLAHDIRNPLAVAVGRLGLERAERDSPHLAAVASALDRIDGIVGDVLTLARDGGAVLDPEPVDVRVVARAAWTAVETADATLDAAAFAVDADPERLRRLLENLFRNAVEHGGPSVSVAVEPTDSGFAVADDGLGVDSADRQRALEGFRNDDARGRGLGLRIVRSLADAHGWEVTLTDSETGGARFEFDLRRPPTVD